MRTCVCRERGSWWGGGDGTVSVVDKTDLVWQAKVWT